EHNGHADYQTQEHVFPGQVAPVRQVVGLTQRVNPPQQGHVVQAATRAVRDGCGHVRLLACCPNLAAQGHSAGTVWLRQVDLVFPMLLHAAHGSSLCAEPATPGGVSRSRFSAGLTMRTRTRIATASWK